MPHTECVICIQWYSVCNVYMPHTECVICIQWYSVCNVYMPYTECVICIHNMQYVFCTMGTLRFLSVCRPYHFPLYNYANTYNSCMLLMLAHGRGYTDVPMYIKPVHLLLCMYVHTLLYPSPR